MSLTGSNADELELVDDACTGTSLAPGVSCSVDVWYRPATVGTKSAKLQAVWAAGSASATLSLPFTNHGAATSPAVSFALAGPASAVVATNTKTPGPRRGGQGSWLGMSRCRRTAVLADRSVLGRRSRGDERSHRSRSSPRIGRSLAGN